MKKLICMFMALAILLAGCNKQQEPGGLDPETKAAKVKLLAACDKYDALKSFEWEGAYGLKADPDSNTYDYVQYMTIIIDRGNNKGSDDDTMYVYNDIGSAILESWVIDNMIHTFDGESISTDYWDANEALDMGLGEMYRKIIEGAEEIKVSTEDDVFLYTVTLNEAVFDALMIPLGDKKNSQSLEKSDKEVYLTLDKDGNIDGVNALLYVTEDDGFQSERSEYSRCSGI